MGAKIFLRKRYQKAFIAIVYCMIGFLPTDCYTLDPPPVTPVDEFFVINNYGIPSIPDNWHLTVEGQVANSLSLTLDDLMVYPAKTTMATLECVGNPLSTELLIGNANWTGIPLHTLIEQAEPLSEVESIILHAVDGYSVVINGESLRDILQRDDIILAYSMNGEMLPSEQGYPLRLVLPGFFGTFWVQWVDRIEITTSSLTNNLAAIPLHAQILKPKNEEKFMIGTHSISGMAVVGEGREITEVEVSTDGGATWQQARLLNYFVANVWKHWEFNWEISEIGGYEIIARAIDNLGNIQEQENGLFGWQILSINVKVDYGCPANEITYSLSGTVTGDVRHGINITLSGSDTSSTTTDSLGNFSFTGLNNCTYTITPSKPNYTFIPPNRSFTISGGNVTGVNFEAYEIAQACTRWADIIAKYNIYVSGQATWSEVITCYSQYVSPQ